MRIDMRMMVGLAALTLAAGARAQSGADASGSAAPMHGHGAMHGTPGKAGMCREHMGLSSAPDVRVENTENGAVVRIEAKDKADVAKIQEHARMMKDCMQGSGSGMHGMHGMSGMNGMNGTRRSEHHVRQGRSRAAAGASSGTGWSASGNDVGSPGTTRSSADPREATAGSSTNGSDVDSKRTGGNDPVATDPSRVQR